MSAQKALDKITEWLAVATQILGYLPSGDLVLAYWFNLLEDFKKELPILHKMASDALKVRKLHVSYSPIKAPTLEKNPSKISLETHWRLL